MLRADTDADEARRPAPEPGPFVHQVEERRRSRRLTRTQIGCENVVLDAHLEPLHRPGRPRSAALDLAEIAQPWLSFPQHRRENVRRRDRILDGEVDSDTAYRRHRMRRVADAEKSAPRP